MARLCTPACESLRNKESASWVYVSRRLSSPLTERSYMETRARSYRVGGVLGEAHQSEPLCWKLESSPPSQAPGSSELT